MKNLVFILFFSAFTASIIGQDITMAQLKSEYISEDLTENRPSLMLADFLGKDGEESDFADLCYFVMDDLINDINYFNREVLTSDEPIEMNGEDDKALSGFGLSITAFIADNKVVAQMQVSKDHGMTILLDKSRSILIEEEEVDRDFSSMPNGKSYQNAIASFYKKLAAPMINDLLSVVASNERLQEGPGESEAMTIDESGAYLLVFENINITQARQAYTLLQKQIGIDQVQISPQNHHEMKVYSELEMNEVVGIVNDQLGEEHMIINQEGNAIFLEQIQ